MNVALASMAWVHGVIVVASLMVPILSPAIAASLGVAPQFASFYGSCIFLATLVALLPAPTIVLRYGGVRASQAAVVLAGLGLAPLALGAMSTSAAVYLLAASAFLIGLSFGPSHPASSHILVRHSPPHLRARIFSLKQASVPVAGIVAGLLLPFLNERMGWQFAVLLGVLLCGLTTLALQPLRARFDEDRQPRLPLVAGSLLDPLKFVWTRPGLKGLALTSAVFAALQFTFTLMSVTFLVEAGGLTLAKAGQVFAAATGASILSRPLWGWAADRWTSRFVLGVLGVAMGMAAFVFASIASGMAYLAVVAIAILVGVSIMSWNGVYLAEVARISSSEDVSLATSGAMFVTYAGALAGPLIYGAFVTLTLSFRGGFILLAAVTVLVALGLLVRRRAEP